MEKKVTVNIGTIFAYSFEIFIAFLCLVMAHFNPLLFVLYVIFVVYEWFLKKSKVIYIILVSFTLLSLCIIKMPTFKQQTKGRVSYVNTNGFVLNHTYYHLRFSKLNVGDEVYVEGTLCDKPLRKKNVSFDEESFLSGKGVYFDAYVDHLEVVKTKVPMVERLIPYVGEELASYYAYFLFGVSEKQNKLIRMLGRELRILHLFAISGMHFQILKKLLVKGASYLLPKPLQEPLAHIVLGGYALALGFNVGAWRSYLCMLLNAYTKLSPLQGLGCVGCIFLLIEPKIFYHTSFIYSMFLYGLVLLIGKERYHTCYLYLGSSLVSMAFQYEIYPLGYVFVLLFTSIVEVCFPLLLGNLLVGNKLGHVLLWLVHGMEAVMEWCSQWGFGLTVARAPTLWYVVIGILFVYACYRRRFYHEGRLWPVFLGVAMMMGLPYVKNETMISMIDVDQGDCFLISLDGRRENYLIDTGGLSYMDVATERIIPFLKSKGITHLDAVFISHSDADHCGALPSLKEHFKVQEVYETFETYHGSSLTIQNLNAGGYDNPNDNSQVLYITINGVSLLMMGDASTAVEDDIIRRYPNLSCTLLKAGHHGSHTSTSNRFLAHVKPKVALISCGLYNSFRHPSKNVLSSLKAYGVQVLRSDQMGDVCLKIEEGKLVLDL